MGVDIFWVFQARKNSKWFDVPSRYDGVRDNYLYSWLGLGGKPIAKPRGMPSDFSINDSNCHLWTSLEPLPPDHRGQYSDGSEGLYQFMGEWGFSWLLATEIMDARLPVTQMRIWVPIDVYCECDKVSRPKRWCELHSDWQRQEDSEHYATPENITDDTWWVIVDWEYDFYEDFKCFLDEVRRLVDLHGDVRFVFGFAG